MAERAQIKRDVLKGQMMTLDQNQKWQAVATRDISKRSAFVWAVRTTGIYCRPGCPARTPKEINVEYFNSAMEARDAGYRACKKCQPDDDAHLLYEAEVNLVASAVAWVDRALEAGDDSSLNNLYAALGKDEAEVRRIIRRYLGITPRSFVESRKLARLRQALHNGSSVTDAVYEAGFEGPRRVYELSNTYLGMTPGRFANKGAGEFIRYAVVHSVMGPLLVAATDKGVCRIMMNDDEGALVDKLHTEFSKAELVPGDAEMAAHVAHVLAYIDYGASLDGLPIDVQATAFEAKVWKGLRDIPFGETRTYGELAKELDVPRAARAVGRACGANPVALAVPCHRVVGQNGKLTGYAWGLERKQFLLEKEKKER